MLITAGFPLLCVAHKKIILKSLGRLKPFSPQMQGEPCICPGEERGKKPRRKDNAPLTQKETGDATLAIQSRTVRPANEAGKQN